MATYLGHQEDSSGNILLPTPHSMATQIEFGTTASQAYAKGAYVVFNNRLCKASTAIASGATLAIGTNLVQCSIGSELNSHLQAPNGNEFYFDYKDGKPGFYPSASKVASQFVPFGGSLSETVLWTNAAPTSNFVGGYGTNLSESIESFKYIKIYFCRSTTNATEGSVIYEKDVFKTYTGATTEGLCGAISVKTPSNYFRRIAYVSSTRMMFMDGINEIGSNANNMLIPTKVCGLK